MRTRRFVSVVTVSITAVAFVGVLLALSVQSVSAQEGLYQKGVHAYLKKDYRNACTPFW